MTRMTMHLATTTAICLGLGLAAPTVYGQDSANTQPEVVNLAEWRVQDLYADGWSAEEFIDEAEVVDPDGEKIGDIENLLIDQDGKLLSVIVEAGGFIDIGDTHLAVPWDQVEIVQDGEAIMVPVNDENIEEYSLFGEWGYVTAEEVSTGDVEAVQEDITTGPSVWRASALINDYARLQDGGINYGYVDDLIFDNEGMLTAVVVEPDIGYGGVGPYAYPFHGFDPYGPYYDLPYAEADIAELEPFDYDQLETDFGGSGATAEGGSTTDENASSTD